VRINLCHRRKDGLNLNPDQRRLQRIKHSFKKLLKNENQMMSWLNSLKNKTSGNRKSASYHSPRSGKNTKLSTRHSSLLKTNRQISMVVHKDVGYAASVSPRKRLRSQKVFYTARRSIEPQTFQLLPNAKMSQNYGKSVVKQKSIWVDKYKHAKNQVQITPNPNPNSSSCKSLKSSKGINHRVQTTAGTADLAEESIIGNYRQVLQNSGSLVQII